MNVPRERTKWLTLLAVLISTCGILAGVALCALLSGRAQAKLLHVQERQQTRNAREEAYVTVLAAYRQFRRSW